ncbi:zinc finger CCHC domain-containing protein 8 -like protein [Asbolus verrucosus]|uniref:Zinc finger CCHC domain-containing protein 8-like protein n=1 Tax=Asbolus verrucosus TaxID=1661398 RepID=A0A482W6F1_ASBVE|nr:zinc finger CCHC domain-containing protein 8 -like protein [Asbolus verrucosus]
MRSDNETSKHNLENTDTEEISENGTNIIILDSSTDECVEETKPEQLEPVETSPCSISIKFHDKSVSEMYKSKFLKFLNSFIELQVKSQDELSVDVYRDETIKVDEWVVIDEIENDAKMDSNTSVVIDTNTDIVVETNTSIIIDTKDTSTPSKKRKKRSKVKKELFVLDATPSPNVPLSDLRYTTKFTINKEKAVEENVDQCPKQTCFNCNQPHSLKDCPQPKDYVKINAARQKFRQQPKSSRYHLEEDQKYSHLVPGKLSDELRKALGLYKNEAPHYIYLMRKFGYPPGWLEEAKFVHSNLDMFDIDGNHVKTTAAKKQGLDPFKIVDFPGFNVPFDKAVKDDYRKYGVPPYSDDFSKTAMINFYDKKFAQGEDNLETCDMDIDHEHESVSICQEKVVKVTDDKGNRDSPSLIDLEQQKQMLLEELNDETKVESKSSTEKDLPCVKTTCFGTPILKSNSPYLTLPNPDNFSKDVSPVINFENLPNSTGKYEQMADVLQKVRSTLKNIHSCNM